jgi:hypothetical protein
MQLKSSFFSPPTIRPIMPTEYAKAYQINSLLNAEEVYRYADQP